MKRFKKLTLFFIVLMVVVIFGADYLVKQAASGKLFSETGLIQHHKVGLLLGTGKYTNGNLLNQFYQYRIEATVALFNSGKIDYVLISGDNSREEYSEPEMMKADLIASGIPPDKIFLDFAGFRTFDSIVRCKEVFGENTIVVISQKFHNERALFIAQRKGMDAVGYNAKDVEGRYGLKVAIREKLARVKLMVDIIFNGQPKYLGAKITIK